MSESGSTGCFVEGCVRRVIGQCPTHLVFFCAEHGSPQWCDLCQKEHLAAQAAAEAAQEEQRRAAYLEQTAKEIIRLQSWAALALWLAFILGSATGLFVTFFVREDWRGSALTWSLQEGHAALADHISSGEYQGLEWRSWAAIGAAGTFVLVSLWWMGLRRARTQVRSIPGLAVAVEEERRRQRQQAWAIAGILLLLFLIPLAIAWAASRDHDHHHEHWDDDW